MSLNRKSKVSEKVVVIYNPNAGKKRKILTSGQFLLEDIKELMEQYQIPADFMPTKYPGHATEIAKEAVRRGKALVIAAGGDGTIGEVANGLVGTGSILGIIPVGTFMNVASMLSVPNDIEKAVQLIKIGRTRKIDVGVVSRLSGERLEKPYYFLESCGIGLEAQLQEYILEIENGNFKSIFKIIKTMFDFFGPKGEIAVDNKRISTRAILVNVSNGPFTGASLPVSPKAKLNDHRLTVNIYKMSKWELLRYFWRARKEGAKYSKKIETYKGKKVKIITKVPRLVHADARLFGETPVEFKTFPNALNVITGFPKPNIEQALIKRTYLDP